MGSTSRERRKVRRAAVGTVAVSARNRVSQRDCHLRVESRVTFGVKGVTQRRSRALAIPGQDANETDKLQ